MYLEWRDVSGNWVQHPAGPDMEPVTIGRNPGSTVYSKETTVSRNHGRIGWDEDGYYIKDLGSSNGSFVNNERTQRAVIREGDTVRCGEVLEIFLRPGSSKKDGGGAPQAERPVAKAMPTTGFKAEDQAKLVALVADKQTQQHAARAGAIGAATTRREPSPAAGPSARPEPQSADRPAAARTAVPTGQAPVVSQPTARPAPTSAGGGDAGELGRRVRALEQSLAEAEARATRAEADVKAIEPRAMRYSVELEGLSEKYVKLKEHNQVIQKELEKTRAELREQEDRLFEAERRATEFEQQIQAAREKATDATEQLSGLKVRITQKDRQIEELQRQLDLLEYELRAARDENESLQSSFNRESNDQGRLERKINLLQEVIQEKEDKIQQLQIDLREKDMEIRQVRMGVGISDLEHEKRQLLQDYHNATRRVDELQERAMQAQRSAEAMKAELEAAKTAAERKPAALVDVSEHPDFKAKAREIERLREELSSVQKELARAQVKFEAVEATGAATKALEAELAQGQKRVETLEAKLRDTEVRLNEALAENQAPKGPTVPADVPETLEALADTVSASASNANLIKRYAQQMEKHKAAAGDLGDSIELMNDIAIVLAQDLKEQERMVASVRKSLGS
ncbi:MAG: FHA domain-containing protein [Myxococcales bacterium]|nr:FHA domain-containing protein [Myxococcales bacterium]